MALLNRNDEAVVVNVSDETEIHFVATQSDGSSTRAIMGQERHLSKFYRGQKHAAYQ